MRRAGRVAHMGEMRITYTILLRKPEGKRPFARSKRRGVIIFKWIFKETRYEVVN
jgi:hypothetical protein